MYKLNSCGATCITLTYGHIGFIYAANLNLWTQIVDRQDDSETYREVYYDDIFDISPCRFIISYDSYARTLNA